MLVEETDQNNQSGGEDDHPRCFEGTENGRRNLASLELESICNFSVQKPVFTERGSIPFLDSFTSFNYWEEPDSWLPSEFGFPNHSKLSPSKNIFDDPIFELDRGVGLVEEKEPKQQEPTPKQKKIKKEKIGIKKQTGSFVIRLRDFQKESSDAQQKPKEEKSESLEDGNSPNQGGKSFSELPTDDSTHLLEWFSPPGLAGSAPYFKLGACTTCKSKKLVFWFGDAASRKKADKLLCVDCIKFVVGEMRFADMVTSSIESNNSSNIFDFEALSSATKGIGSLENTSKKPDYYRFDEETHMLNSMIESKRVELTKLLSKSTKCLRSSKHSADLESKLLAIKFTTDLVDCLLRANRILSSQTLHRKLELMENCEKIFFRKEIAKGNSISALHSILERSRKNSEVDLFAACSNSIKQPALKKSSFCFDFEDKSPLNKRELEENLTAAYPIKCLFASTG